jgi:coenzyme F420-0:L-glutamate ligase/coenzyme F420-1:gamma-L-glutamate ligase
VRKGEALPSLILHALGESALELLDRDVVVVTQKVVSKAEGRAIDLTEVSASGKASRLAKMLGKDPRIVELILMEAKRVVRWGHGVIITETKHGFVCANSGVDQSNVEEGYATTLPIDPDGSARRLRRSLEEKTGKKLAVVITDTFGRPWREGQVDVAIGCSGIEPLSSLRGALDPYGYRLKVTEPAVVDEIAAASELVMRKLEMVPAAVVRGVKYERGEGGVSSLVRKRKIDLFR